MEQVGVVARTENWELMSSMAGTKQREQTAGGTRIQTFRTHHQWPSSPSKAVRLKPAQTVPPPGHQLFKLGSQWGASHSNNNRYFLLNISNAMASGKTFSKSIFSPKAAPSGSGGGCRWWYRLMTTAWLGKGGGLKNETTLPHSLASDSGILLSVQ